MLRWLLEIGGDIEQTDDFGQTPLMIAVERNNCGAAEDLLQAGANLAQEYCGQTALYLMESREMGLLLLTNGADPCHLSQQGHRLLTGLPPAGSWGDFEVTTEEYLKGRIRRFGIANPERIQDPFLEAMIRTGFSTYVAQGEFKGRVPETKEPGWCAQRFGQSITFLPNGCIVQIGGEHEDGYDPDFCIYNDVFVHHARQEHRDIRLSRAHFSAHRFPYRYADGRALYLDYWPFGIPEDKAVRNDARLSPRRGDLADRGDFHHRSEPRLDLPPPRRGVIKE